MMISMMIKIIVIIIAKTIMIIKTIKITVVIIIPHFNRVMFPLDSRLAVYSIQYFADYCWAQRSQ